MRLYSTPNCCGVRYLTELYDNDGWGKRVILKEADEIKIHLDKLQKGCSEPKMYLAFFAGKQINNRLYKACLEFGFQEYPKFKNNTGNVISTLFWIHPKAVI